MASPSPMTSPIAPSPYLKTEGGITMDLIVTAQDRAKYHNTFTKLDRGTGLISLKIVKALWKKTPLADPVLAHIWKLSDMDRDKHLNEEEFAVGMKLVTLCVTGHLPETDLPDKVVVRVDMSGMSPLPPPPFSPPQTPASDTGEHPSPAGPSTSADQSPTTTTTTRTHTARGQAHGSSGSARTQDTGTHTDSNNNNDDDNGHNKDDQKVFNFSVHSRGRDIQQPPGKDSDVDSNDVIELKRLVESLRDTVVAQTKEIKELRNVEALYNKQREVVDMQRKTIAEQRQHREELTDRLKKISTAH